MGRLVDKASEGVKRASAAVPTVIAAVGVFDRVRSWWLARPIVQERRAAGGWLAYRRKRKRERRER